VVVVAPPGDLRLDRRSSISNPFERKSRIISPGGRRNSTPSTTPFSSCHSVRCIPKKSRESVNPAGATSSSFG
jgi:hypothetical protein